MNEVHMLRFKWADDDESYWRVETFPSAAARNRWVRSWDRPAARGENVPAIEVLEHGEWRAAALSLDGLTRPTNRPARFRGENK